ncbi:methylmalonyl-CoA epimerase [Metabacillus sp. GX 13764]|uniref:methylmalonyl-CoA epimerase n=1 Tax=Metabacillus kandeliae TaxID=2900151 RepID=UPI001E57D9F7|nr:methylmalonyl-CoA epimerase [Metabacillus kandeliae]MCD7033244.1 methylmalonyl-CoA epimerase [Metabacillus kandeliae]
MVEKVDHLGVAVRSIENSLPFYTEVLGMKLLGMETVESQQVKVAFLTAENTKIELLEPSNENSPVAKFIEKRGEGIHHVAYAVKNISESLASLENQGIQLIDKTPRKGAGGAMIAFLHPKSSHGVLTELCEKRESGERN